MRKIVINGGNRISGKVTISGAKNSVVALIPATILANDVVTLEGVPDISDVTSLIDIMEVMGAKIERDVEAGVLVIDTRDVKSMPLPYGKINSLRASYYFNGALLGRFGRATVGLPGGCDLGPRPIDLHIKAFEALGAEMSFLENAMHLEAKKDSLFGTTIYMDMVSVGATINTMLAASTAEGMTIIENAAREPEIIDVATLLNNMGAKVRGAGTDVIRIQGTKKLHGARHTVIPDRIEAGTYLALAAAIGDGVIVDNVIFEHLDSFIAKLEEMGVRMTIREDSIEVHKSENLKAVNIKTVPYPGFATDLQQPITPLLLSTNGRGWIMDTIYEKRVNHVPEMARMGAKISVINDKIVYDASNQLTGTQVKATDLRAGAGLVVAGAIASGTTTISNIDFILRGYDSIIEKMTALGVDIKLIEE
ncbi:MULTISPECIES: UDP-N-acetylglucosamine 1-carboxyvinyltransferase [unclassified Lactococcus]|uniref:UDP-N-acetylglucosamine 1-carboxyvinyltransferase n=1 Tax=unclassified Lactococcus TaxID=2643510 RepID=UPI0011CAEC96|nr:MULTISPECIES: UDP-N-acetylglucosamine 1-carboxyvinyltransferase [unclassified Lactococcus]MQW23715.1 UDP-N-acetylglucosamine 1-carboxyvinyltransferase [Lactococcus sp. dk101]TXK37547.1 UDP-N-acetylglucosamine 1-carboxyvinyltransferase [Lactococcus sp. dk310]TXK48935.1 UDP-N-acetylglucosamine 1-carboxyvinyltransferase [Lactococcus sp. dk322]